MVSTCNLIVHSPPGITLSLSSRVIFSSCVSQVHSLVALKWWIIFQHYEYRLLLHQAWKGRTHWCRQRCVLFWKMSDPHYSYQRVSEWWEIIQMISSVEFHFPGRIIWFYAKRRNDGSSNFASTSSGRLLYPVSGRSYFYKALLCQFCLLHVVKTS